jgi:zinc transporter ZupT
MTPVRSAGVKAKLSALFAWVGVACLVIVAAFFGWWLVKPGNENALTGFAVACVFIVLCLVAWSSRWKAP